MFSVKFNGVEIPPFIKVTNVNTSILPNVSPVSVKIGKMVGERFSRLDFGTREIVLSCKFMFDVLDLDKRVGCVKWLKGDNWKPSKLQFNGSTKYYMAVCSTQVDLADLIFLGEGEIVFTCYDPLLYDVERQEVLLGEDVEIINNGNIAVYPRVEITTGGQSRIRVRNNTNGSSVLVNGDFVTDGKLVIDCSKQYITFNDVSAMKGFTLASDWLKLETGKNNIIVTYKDGSLSGTSMKLFITEAYL